MGRGLDMPKGPKCQVCRGQGWTCPENGDINDREDCLQCLGTGIQDKGGDNGLILGREE